MRVCLYARVSTSDKEQDPQTQLIPLRQFVEDQGWENYEEFIDYVPATDIAPRVEWRKLLDDASKRRFDLLLVWRMDRAFRSVLDAATTLERLRTWGVGLRSYTEPWLDTTSPFGERIPCSPAVAMIVCRTGSIVGVTQETSWESGLCIAPSYARTTK